MKQSLPQDKDQLPLPRLINTEVLKALADTNRLLLIGRLIRARAPLTVTEASSCCGVHISGVSRHLAILRRAGLVLAEKRGREVVYRAAVNALVASLRQLADVIEQLGTPQGCCPQLKESNDA